MKRSFFLISLGLFFITALDCRAQPFLLPTANRAIFEPGGEERYFVPTVGKTWVSGTFGAVRSDGWQIHEGLDIRCLQRDRHGEPIDPVMATADGTVVYMNTKPSLSNYGNYLVLRHLIQGLEIYSVYAHLSSIRDGLKTGQSVRAGETIAIMGRTANTHEGISKERAHVHFELNLLMNDRFADWYRQNSSGQRNDHGNWNGQNLAGIDARLIFLEQQKKGSNFNLVQYIASEPVLMRVAIRSASFPWLKRYAPLIKHNPAANKAPVAGYEVAFDFNGVAIELIPRTAAELKTTAKYTLLSVNEPEETKNPARRFVIKRGSSWQLTSHALNLLSLLTF